MHFCRVTIGCAECQFIGVSLPFRPCGRGGQAQSLAITPRPGNAHQPFGTLARDAREKYQEKSHESNSREEGSYPLFSNSLGSLLKVGVTDCCIEIQSRLLHTLELFQI